MIKSCKICGKLFNSKGRKFICDDQHYNTCIVCGKQFEVDRNTYTRTTCSKECVLQRNRDAAIARNSNKSTKWTNESSQGEYIKSCILCGSEFRTDSKSRTVCYNDHVVHCEICGEEFHVGPPNFYYKRTCSYSCAAELRAREHEAMYGTRSTLQRPDVLEKIRKSNLEKFGVENPLSSSEVREKIKLTCLEKFGVEFATQSDQMKSKSQATCLSKYGVKHALQSDEIRSRIAQTNLQKYGVENIFSSPEFRSHVQDLNQERYGVDHYVESDDFKKKRDATWAEKYGGNPWSCQDVRDKCNQTNLLLYGNIWPQCTDDVRQKQIDTFIAHRAAQIQDEDARQNYLEFKHDPKKYIEEHHRLGINIEDMAKDLGYSDGTMLYDYVHKHGMEDVLRWSGMSKMEQEILDFIHLLDPSIEVRVHDRTVIYPKELDLYLPQYKIGIECNPTITHNSTFVIGNVLGNLTYPVTPIDYHIMKTNRCEDQGVFLFHVFGYEWKNHKNVLLSMIQNLLGRNESKYYARKLNVREVSPKDAIQFLELNHRQGSANSLIRLGLYDGDMLVSLMTFGHARRTIGSPEDQSNNVIELIRFCNLVNTSVIGGASKLFKYYIQNYNPSKVVSFSDRAHTKGNLYSTLGFHEVSRSNPGYVWVNLSTNLYFNRLSCQKRNLPKLLGEPDLDTKNQTEEQIMSSRGFVQVFDSGTIRWEYNVNLNR